jgi:hypothetical protein
MEREKIHTISFGKRKVIENGQVLPPTEAKYWRQKLREERDIWSGKYNNGRKGK